MSRTLERLFHVELTAADVLVYSVPALATKVTLRWVTTTNANAAGQAFGLRRRVGTGPLFPILRATIPATTTLNFELDHPLYPGDDLYVSGGGVASAQFMIASGIVLIP